VLRHKILDLIVACGLSVHDISRVQFDGGSKLPRFNMPLELGADLGLRLKGPARQRDRRLLVRLTHADFLWTVYAALEEMKREPKVAATVTL
jgi:hypothetical protein